MDSAVNGSHSYPAVWVRWVEQQVRTAVAYELVSGDPGKGTHLRRLPLTIQAHVGDREMFLRQLIAGLAGQSGQAAAVSRTDYVTAAVLATAGVHIAEPDLQLMLAWHLAERHTIIPGTDECGSDPIGTDHECFDPELLAAEMVASGLIAPAWRLREIHAMYDDLDERTRIVAPAPPRRTRRSAVPAQLALPFTA